MLILKTKSDKNSIEILDFEDLIEFVSKASTISVEKILLEKIEFSSGVVAITMKQ